MSTAPVIIAFDGSPAAERALRQSATLLAGHRALVVTVWEAGRLFEIGTMPVVGFDMPPTVLDIRGAIQADLQMYESAKQTAQHGAVLARQSGFEDATGLTVADELTVADTLIRLAREHNSPGIVVGSHGHRKLTELLLGSTSSHLVHKADCPVVVVRAAG